MANKITVNRAHFNTLVNDNAALSGSAFTGDVSTTGDVRIDGSLNVVGVTTTVKNLDISDNLIGLNNGLTGSDTNANDSGIIIGRGSAANAFMGWDESAQKFTVGTTDATASNIGNLGITAGTLVANLEAATVSVSGALNVDGGIACDTDKFTVADATGNTAIAGTLDVNGAVNLNATTTSSSSTTGALIVDGGIGVAGNANVGGTLGVTGALNANGGFACDIDKFTVANTSGNTVIAGTLDVTGAVNLNATTTSSSSTTGALIVDGGVGVAENANVGGTLDVTGAVNLNATTTSSSSTTGALIVDGGVGVAENANVGGTLGVTGALNANGGFACDIDKFTVANTSGNTVIAGTLDVTGAVNLNATTTSSSSTTGALIVDGGVGVAENANVGGTLGVTGALNANGGFACDIDKFTVANTSGNTVIAGTLDVTGAVNLNATTTSSSSTTGALIVDGGVGVAENANVGGTLDVTGAVNLNATTTSSSSTTGALIVDGGVGVAENANVGGTLGVTGVTTLAGLVVNGTVNIDGSLNFTGDATTIDTINLDISDNIIGLNNGLTSSNTNDSGVMIERGDLSNAFMGWDESVQKFTVGTTNDTASSIGNLEITTGTLVANLEAATVGVTGTLTYTSLNDGTNTISATAAELNIMDGDTTQASVGLAGTDGIVMNDDGTMRQCLVSDITTYVGSSLTSASSLVTVGELTSGSIGANFGAIDNGTSNITTGGLLQIDIDTAATPAGDATGIGAAGSLTLGLGGDAGLYVANDNLYIENKTTDKDIIFRVSDDGTYTTVATVDGDVGLFNFATGKLAIGGTAVSATAAELNIMDGGTTQATVGLTGTDGIVMNDDGTMRQCLVSDFNTYIGANLVSTGVLNSGSIATNFGAIDNGTSNITTGGLLQIDIDTAATPAGNATGIGAAGSLTLGLHGDAGLYVASDNLYIENKTTNKDIIFRVSDDGTYTTVATVDGDVGLFNFATGKLAIGGTAVSATAAELNIMDGGTTQATVGLTGTDGIVMNDDGTMRQCLVSDFNTYIGANLVSTGVLNSGSIATNFGAIDNGTSNITTGGLLQIDVDTAVTPAGNATGIGAAGSLTLGLHGDAGLYVASDNLYIENKTTNKDIIFRVSDDGTYTTVATVDGDVGLFNFATGKLAIGGTAVSATAAELNIMDGGTTQATVGLTGTDGIVMNDDGTMRQCLVSDFNTYIGANLVSTGVLNSGSIAANFGAIDNGTSNITTGGLLKIDVDGTAIGAAGSLTLGLGGDAGLYVNQWNNLVIENINNNKEIIFRVNNDNNVGTNIATIEGDTGLFNFTTGKLAIGGTAVSATAAELNIMDGGATVGTTAVTGGDGIVMNDDGTMKQTNVDTFDTYLSATTKTLTNKTLTDAKGVTSTKTASVSYSSNNDIRSGAITVPGGSLITNIAVIVTTQLTHNNTAATTVKVGNAADGNQLALSVDIQASGVTNTAVGKGTAVDAKMATALEGAAALVIKAGEAYRINSTDVHITVTGGAAISGSSTVQFIVEYINF